MSKNTGGAGIPRQRRIGPGQRRDMIFSYAYLLPFLLIFFTFTVVPVVVSIGLSFTDYNILEPPRFIFLQNYLKLFLSDDEFLIAVKNTLIIAVITGPVGYILSLLFAWSINELRPMLRAIMVLVFYAPSISGGVYMIWTIMFSGDAYGYMNALLLYTGVIDTPIQWLTDPSYDMFTVIVVVLWGSMGTGFLSFVAGFQSLNRSYYEAGAIDGIRNRWQELWYITLPQMLPQLLIGAVLTISGSFAIGAQCSALTGFPSTDYSTHTLVLHIQDYGLLRLEMGYACTVAVVLFIIMVTVWIAIDKAIRALGNGGKT